MGTLAGFSSMAKDSQQEQIHHSNHFGALATLNEHNNTVGFTSLQGKWCLLYTDASDMSRSLVHKNHLRLSIDIDFPFTWHINEILYSVLMPLKYNKLSIITRISYLAFDIHMGIWNWSCDLNVLSAHQICPLQEQVSMIMFLNGSFCHLHRYFNVSSLIF